MDEFIQGGLRFGTPQKQEQNTAKVFASIAKMYIFATLQGINPLTPMPPAGGSVRGHGPRKGELLKNKENARHLHIELTQEQYQTLTDKAKQAGLTKRAFIVRLLNGQEIRERPNEEIRQLRTEIHRIGNNINQIARSVNAGIADAADVKRGLYILDQIYEILYQIGR